MSDENVLIAEEEQEQDKKQEQEKTSQDQKVSPSSIFNLDHDLVLLLLILLVFFSKRDIFSEQLQSLNKQANNIKSYLEAADATLQALDQASQLPQQILN